MADDVLFGYAVVLVLWLSALVREGGIGIGFRFMYSANLFLFFLLGPLLGAVFGSDDPRFRRVPQDPAARLALYAFAIYLVVAYWAFPAVLRRRTLKPPDLAQRMSDPHRLRAQETVAWWLIAIGVLSLPLTGRTQGLPTIGAALSQLGTLLDTGLAMLCLNAAITRRRGLLLGGGAVFVGRYIVAAALSGHAGNMFIFGMVLASLFLFAFRFRLRDLPTLTVLAVLAFILASYWLAGRGPLRQAVKQGAGWQQQLDLTLDIFLNPADSQLDFVSAYRNRGDFSDLMAMAMAHTPANQPFAGGDQYFEAFGAVVPRILWPTKSYKLGGSDFVSKYTGVQFDAATSVGMNYLFEMYVSSGYPGVGIGMAVLGVSLGWMEYWYYRHGLKNLATEFTLLFTSWTVCFNADRFAMAAMCVIPGLAVCWLVGQFLMRLYDLPYLARLPAVAEVPRS